MSIAINPGNLSENTFKNLAQITANKPSFELDIEAEKNSPVLQGIAQSALDVPVKAAAERDTFEKSEDADTQDFMDYESSLDFKIKQGMSREQLATYYGDLGRKLDEAYAAGEYTEEEYNSLNAGLLESYDNAITRCEYEAAADEVDKAESLQRESEMAEVTVRKRRGMTNIEKILNGMGVEIKGSYENSREMVSLNTGELRNIINELTESLRNGPDEDYNGEKMTHEQQHAEDIKAFISRRNRLTEEFAAEYCATDRNAMMSMMNTVRQGGELLGGRDEIYGIKQAQSWFIEGYTPLPDTLAGYLNM